MIANTLANDDETNFLPARATLIAQPYLADLVIAA
jgi:hypothetical protein